MCHSIRVQVHWRPLRKIFWVKLCHLLNLILILDISLSGNILPATFWCYLSNHQYCGTLWAGVVCSLSIIIMFSLFESYNRRVLESTTEVSQGEDQELDENQSGNVEEKDYATSLKYDNGEDCIM